MWSFRTLVLVLAAFAAGACGFQPLYGTRFGGDAPAELAQIRITPIPDRTGQQLHNELLTALNPDGRPERPLYVLTTQLNESLSTIGVKRTGFSTRANLELNASYVLRRINTSDPVFTSQSAITVSYDILDSEFATLMAEKEARTRAARELGQEMRIQLGAFFSSRKPESR
jgi:LPS-assembly lipoprotein